MADWWWREVAYSLGARQRALMTAGQLVRRSVARDEIETALRAERIHRIHRGVYSLVPEEHLPADAVQAAAVLLGGEGARLHSHSACKWLELSKAAPDVVHVATPSKLAEVEGIRWHRLPSGAGPPYMHDAMPVTHPLDVPISVAADLGSWDLKGVLAELEYRFGIPAEALRATTGRGIAGSANLNRAIADHTPLLAETRSHLEREFLIFVVERRFEPPAGFNYRDGVATVDVDYRSYGVVVELDGVRGHQGERRILRDHRRDLYRRAGGLLPLRYHYSQLMTPRDRDLIEADLERAGIPRLGLLAA